MLIALGVGLFAAWPFLQYAGLPEDTDAELHVYRTAEIGYSIKAGDLYPRWAPDFYHGYGYPIFNYYAPLTYHLSYALTFGRPELAVFGTKATFVLAHLVGAVGAYLLGRRSGGPGGGLVGAAGFSLAPYIQLINPHIRGDLAEVFAVAALPWVLWAWERVWETGRRGAMVTAVFWTAVVFLSHNLTGLTTLVLIALLSLWRWLGEDRHANLLPAVMAAVIFVLLTAFFWLPFLVERDAIQLDVAGEGHYDFRNHFVPLRELLTPVPPMDRRGTTLGAPMSVGPVILVLALYGAVRGVRHRQARALAPYLIAGGLLFWLVTFYSQPLWEFISPMAFFQFPWRFLGPLAALLVPLLAHLNPASVGGESGPERPRPPVEAKPAPTLRLLRVSLPVFAVAAILLAAMPALYPLPWTSNYGRTTRKRIIAAELRGRWRGTTSTNDFVPSTVDTIPGPTETVLTSYETPPVDRVNRHTLPEGAQVDVLPDDPWVNRFAVDSDTAFLLRLHLFDFPGWRAYVGDTEVPIEIAHPEGFITVPVPAGSHEVVVRFGATPARTVGWILTTVGVLGAGGLFVGRSRVSCLHRLGRGAFRGSTASAGDGPKVAAFTREYGVVASIAVIFLGLGLAKVLIFDPLGWFRYTSPIGESYAATYEQDADFGGQIELLGYDLPAHRVEGGGLVEVTLYWQAQHELTRTYQSFVHLVYPEGEIWAQSDHLNPGGYPTDLWSTDRYVRDTHRLRIPTEAPPGSYLVTVGLYSLFDDERLPVVRAECGQRPDSVVLCHPITVRR